MTGLSDYFYKNSTFTLAILITLLTAGYFGFVMTPEVGYYSGSSFETSFSFEKSIGYSYDDALTFFKEKSITSTSDYRELSVGPQGIFALLYATMCLAWLSFLWKPIYKNFGLSHIVNLFPLFLLLLELAEHSLLIVMTDMYLQNQEVLASHVLIGSTLSICKWTASFLITVLAGSGIFIRWYQAGEKKSTRKIVYG